MANKVRTSFSKSCNIFFFKLFSIVEMAVNNWYIFYCCLIYKMLSYGMKLGSKYFQAYSKDIKKVEILLECMLENAQNLFSIHQEN